MARRGFSYTVHSGRTVALVGESGCGKTTLLYLVQRLYDTANPSNELTPGDQTINQPESGVFLDGINIKYFSPRWLRQQIGIVAQEPELFDISLADNIAYGDNSRKVSMEEIIEASMQANIHDFVMSLPKGYQTMAGSGGSHLSGGQKQRIAIARALVRHPSILLLDEATSALDAESERLVQSALDSAACDTKGVHRTCLVVAHRLSTVQTADTVVVIQRGQKMESGSPKTLLEAKGAYYALYHASKISEP
ncbi:unnamed protein product [Protopolystoma xenopodis]|uniref:ABC transporter domain-containing protein n=1 Tax=Protopolystoma xenopodis TaxID=117903 RepID=A0A3S5AE12_9PLAT|nr:unnamed protein product [Protopolystoma xenopodis]